MRRGRFSNVASCATAVLRPPPGRRIRPNASGADNSRKPRPIVLAASPVAADTAAIPPYPAADASAAATTRRPRSLRNGATAENRCRIAATSTIYTRYGILTCLRILHLQKPNHRFAYLRTGPKCSLAVADRARNPVEPSLRVGRTWLCLDPPAEIAGGSMLASASTANREGVASW